MLQMIQNWDESVLLYIQENIREPFWNNTMPVITMLGNMGILWLLLSVIYLLFHETRRLGIYCLCSLVVDAFFCNILIKPLVARIRPYDALPQLRCIISKQIDYSMPSGHAAAAFAFATVVFLRGNKIYGTVFLLFSAVIGFSRLYVGVHYPTDVIAGSLLGIACGIVSCRLMDAFPFWKSDREGERKISKLMK